MTRAPSGSVRRCAVCGGSGWGHNNVMFPELVEAWRLSPKEAAEIESQQGDFCARCGEQRRCVTLADGIRRAFGVPRSLPFRYLPIFMPWLRVLEINYAGTLHKALRHFPRHRLVEYPEVSMERLPFADGSFDLVVHSDTLEHVPEPELGLRECLRVVGGGWVAYTIPIVAGRMSRRRGNDEPISYHGGSNAPDYRVITEYGADAWSEAMRAGATEVRIVSNDHPVSHAMLIRSR